MLFFGKPETLSENCLFLTGDSFLFIEVLGYFGFGLGDLLTFAETSRLTFWLPGSDKPRYFRFYAFKRRFSSLSKGRGERSKTFLGFVPFSTFLVFFFSFCYIVTVWDSVGYMDPIFSRFIIYYLRLFNGGYKLKKWLWLTFLRSGFRTITIFFYFISFIIGRDETLPKVTFF